MANWYIMFQMTGHRERHIKTTQDVTSRWAKMSGACPECVRPWVQFLVLPPTPQRWILRVGGDVEKRENSKEALKELGKELSYDAASPLPGVQVHSQRERKQDVEETPALHCRISHHGQERESP